MATMIKLTAADVVDQRWFNLDQAVLWEDHPTPDDGVPVLSITVDRNLIYDFTGAERLVLLAALPH